MLAVFLLSGITGIMLFLDVPSRNIYEVHSWSGIALVVLIALHLALHLKWIVCTTKALFRKKGESAGSGACSCIPQPCLPEHVKRDKT